MVLTKIPGGLIEDGSITSADITDSTITNAKMALDPANASNLNSGDVPSAQLGNDRVPDLSSQSNDIARLGFKTQANGNLARYSLVDQAVDAFEDTSGVDASASSGENRNAAGKYYSGLIPGNYYGDDSLGNCQFKTSGITQTGHTQAINGYLTTGSSGSGPGNSSYGNEVGQADVPNMTGGCYETTVLNKVGAWDGDMWVWNC